MLRFESIDFSYPQKSILKNASFAVKKGELIAVMGESGCGKTTLLQLIAGLQKPQSGSVICDASRISYVFQEPRLFPWMTVAENIRAVLPDTSENTDCLIADVLEAVLLTDAANQYPDALSGGMKMRASIARALSYDGDLFLLDEPFSALDEKMKKKLLHDIRIYLQKNEKTAILVTHQQEDAEAFADRIIDFSEFTK